MVARISLPASVNSIKSPQEEPEYLVFQDLPSFVEYSIFCLLVRLTRINSLALEIICDIGNVFFIAYSFTIAVFGFAAVWQNYRAPTPKDGTVLFQKKLFIGEIKMCSI